MADVVAAWPAAVGEAISQNAWPARIGRDGTLHVSTSSSAWAFELAHLAPEMLARLAAVLHESAPKALRFSPGPLPEISAPDEGTPARPAGRDPTPEERVLGAELSAEIDNEGLRELVARAAAGSLAARRSDRST